MAELLSAQTFSQHFEALFFELCQDQVAEVRIAATQATLRVMTLLFNEDKELYKAFLEKMKVFKKHRKYNIRQTFILMCESVLLGENQVHESIFFDSLITDFVEL